MKAHVTMNTEASSEDSSAILDEFFGGGGQFQQVRKKAMRRPGRSPAKKSSITLNRLEQEQQQQQQEEKSGGVGERVSSTSELAPTRSVLKKQRSIKEKRQRSVKIEKEVKDLHLDDRNVVSDLIHRVTQLSGLEPGAQRVVKTPANMVERGQAMKDLQFKEFMDPTEHFKDTIGSIVEIHKEIEVMAQNIFYFRQSLGRELKELNGIFIKQFQLLISEILTMHRNKFQSQTETVNALLHRLDALENDLNDCKEQCDVLKSSKSMLEAENERMTALCDNKDLTIKILQDELAAMEKSQKDYMETLEKQRLEDELEAQKRKEDDKQMMMQERQLLLKQRQDLQAELMRQNALAQESAMIQSNKAAEKLKKVQQGIFKAVNKKVDCSTQTEYDDFGAWDRQSGWTLPISGTVKARNRWRKSLLYATCPSCRGVGAFMSAAAAQYKHFLRGEVIVDDTHDPKKWRIPDQIVRFMNNLPRAIQAEELHDTRWVIRHVWNFFDSKVKRDADDISLGQPLQAFSDFIIDIILQRCERRVDAESYLFIFLKSLQSCLAKKKTPLLHTFARFLGVFGASYEENETEVVSSSISHSSSGSPTKSKVNDRERNPRKSTMINKGKKVTVESTNMKVPNTNLSRGILDVYLFSRSCMLKPYSGLYANGIKIAKSATTELNNLSNNKERLEGAVGDRDAGWGLEIPPHICISDNSAAWVPLDRALQVSTAVLGFLSEKQMLALHRQVEHEAMFLNKHGELVEPEGSHTVIRAAVRKILKQNVEKISEDEHDTNSQDDTVIVVNMEKVLQSTIQQLSTRISVVEARLVRLFVEGDDNGDGELSFREFKSIVSKVAPHFNMRTQLKMFREALMSGNDDSSITEQGFVAVCRKYGLVQLVDLESLHLDVMDQYDEKGTSSNRQPRRNTKSISESIVLATNKMLKEKKDEKAVSASADRELKADDILQSVLEMRKQSIGEYAVHKVDGNESLIHKYNQGSKSKSVDITKKSIADEQTEMQLLQLLEARIRNASPSNQNAEHQSSFLNMQHNYNTNGINHSSNSRKYSVLVDDSDDDSEDDDDDDDDECLRRMIQARNF